MRSQKILAQKTKPVKIKIDPTLYNRAYYKFLGLITRIQIFFGGSSSGKSRFLAQRLVFDLLSANRNYLVIRKVAKTIRKSVFTEVVKVITQYKLAHLFWINKSEMVITCMNGYQAYFEGLDDPEKLKSITAAKGTITDLWIEEATEISRDDYKLLIKRLRGWAPVKKRITFSFNPIFRTHWIYAEFFKSIGWADDQKKHQDDDLFILRTTYQDNQFLTKDDIKALEGETDDYYREVYTLGIWGVLGNVIFSNWEIRDIKKDPIYKTFDIFRNGLDFGFSNDPTAFNKSYYHRASRTLYVVDEFNALEITNPEIAKELKPGLNGDHVVCDSAEPKSIKELNSKGLNATGARKGPDSVIHGIQWLKQQHIVIDKRCINTISNFQQYHWKKDKEGNSINVPVDKDNDHIDAIRYSCEDLMHDIEDLDILVGRSRAA